MPQSPDDLVPLGPPPTDADIQAFLEAGRRNDAIQAYRLLYHVDLRTAKEAIAARERFMPPTPSTRWLCAALLGLGGGLFAFFMNQDHPWRAIEGILFGFLAAWKFFSLNEDLVSPRRGAPTSQPGPEPPPAGPASSDRHE